MASFLEQRCRTLETMDFAMANYAPGNQVGSNRIPNAGRSAFVASSHCRALLDSGSQLHLITSRLANQLQVKKIKSSVSVTGIGDSSFVTDGHSVNITIQSRTSEYSANITAVIAPNITGRQPSFNVDIGSWNVPKNIQLADPMFYAPQRVDLLIGDSLFFEMLCVGQIKLPPGLPLMAFPMSRL